MFIFFLCFCCKTRMKIWERRTPENAIAICSFIIHWNQIPWAEADDKTSKDFCSLWMNFHCCIIASEMLWVASASATQRARRRKKQCLFLYVIHMMLFYLSAAHNDGDDEKKEEKNVSRNIILKFQRQTSCEDFFSVFIQMCAREKWAKEFLAIWLHFCSWLRNDSSWGKCGDRKLSRLLEPELDAIIGEKSFSDFSPLAGRTKANFSSFSSSTTHSLSRFSRIVQLKVSLAFSARLSRERTVKELGRSIRKISRSSCDLNRKTKRRRIIFHISCSDI